MRALHMMDETQAWDRRTGMDRITSYLYGEIVSLRLLPGAKISETEIAARFGVSRQPVRDAFNRLANLDLLLIRPQRSTEVKRFSNKGIEKARFVRASVESEVLRRAARYCGDADARRLDLSLEEQRSALSRSDSQGFITLDYEFHRTLCEIAGVDYAFDVIATEKAKVDRLCMLSLSKEDRMPQLVEDHKQIAEMVKAQRPEKAVAAGMLHLTRLDSTIELIKQQHASYFDDAD